MCLGALAPVCDVRFLGGQVIWNWLRGKIWGEAAVRSSSARVPLLERLGQYTLLTKGFGLGPLRLCPALHPAPPPWPIVNAFHPPPSPVPIVAPHPRCSTPIPTLHPFPTVVIILKL